MKFDVVIGNPPYNNGSDLDFVNKGYEITNKYVCMITPAKWQTAEANQRVVSKISYGDFRKSIVPHMSYVCFYPNCSDVFLIAELAGITWYLIDKNKNYKDKCIVENKAKHQVMFNNKEIRDITQGQTLNNLGFNIYSKYFDNKTKFKMPYITGNKKYSVISSKIFANERGIENTYQAHGVISYKTGQMSVTRVPRLILTSDVNELGLKNNECVFFESDNIDECNSYISYVETKLIRFLLSLNIGVRAGLNKKVAWKCVPEPPFGYRRTYTDQELFDYFGIDNHDKNCIDKIIKDRKEK